MCRRLHMPYRVFTQDTSITYAQTAFDMPLSLKPSIFGVDPIEKITGSKLQSGDSNKKVLFNSLSYEAASAVWIPHVNSTQATLLAGSGISYGQSLSTTNFNSILEGSEGGRSLLEGLATQLHVQTDLLELALERSSILVGSEISAVLVESSFSAGVGLELPITRDGIEPQLDKDLMKRYGHREERGQAAPLRERADGVEMPLQAIRVRFRIADTLDESATFKLGIPIGIFKVGIELNAVAKAGATGIVDLCTTWFGKRMKFNTSGMCARGFCARRHTHAPIGCGLGRFTGRFTGRDRGWSLLVPEAWPLTGTVDSGLDWLRSARTGAGPREPRHARYRPSEHTHQGRAVEGIGTADAQGSRGHAPLAATAQLSGAAAP